MKREIVLIPALVGGLLAMTATPSQANSFCADRAEMVKSLSDKFEENPAALGQINGEAVIEVFVSEKGSWTILATGTDGKSCVISAGNGFEINVAAIGEGA
ncbi:MAG: hypothetical protein M3Y43_01165 [Pseudomonadota bacterium]|nr:hypothetical protein [Pseudomonadota bacterium]MDQ2703752.1 hypothetical protein [Pseudomonadota bacterium]